MKTLDALRWRPAFITYLGCVKSCLDFLGIDISRPELYGGTGHAYVINIHEQTCPSGPTAWKCPMLYELAPNLGYEVRGVFAWKAAADPTFTAAQRQAWDFVRAEIAAGHPCFGWQLRIPDYYLITGYDDVGYYYAGWLAEEGAGPLPWDQLGTWDVTMVNVNAVAPAQPAAPEQALHDAFAAALKHAFAPGDWINPHYASGPAAFDLWESALESGRAWRDGHTYNAQAWGECRAMAVEHLLGTSKHLPALAPLLHATATHYALVRDRLADLVVLHPPRPDADWRQEFASAEAAALVRQAGEAERRGLAGLEAIVHTLAGGTG